MDEVTPVRPELEGVFTPEAVRAGAVHPTHRAIAPSDPLHMRQCLSRFATGVVIVATRASDGRPVGLTASSFNSLSLNPPLILWSLGTSASTLEVFKGQRFFSVNVLKVEQVDIARRFATRGVDRFSGVEIHEGLDGIPLIAGALGWFECERRTQTLHGDHWLFIGEVKRCAAVDGSPLIFRHGEFASAESLPPPTPGSRPSQPSLPPQLSQSAQPEPPEPPEPTTTPTQTSARADAEASLRDLGSQSSDFQAQPFHEEYLPFLLTRAGHQLAGGFQRQLRTRDFGMLSWRVLAALSSRDGWTISELGTASLAKQPTLSKLIDRLERRGLVVRTSDPTDARRVLVSLTDQGQRSIAPVLNDAASFNRSLLADFPPEELTALKRVLRKMIARTPLITDADRS